MRIGVDVGGTKLEAIALDGTREVARIRVPTPRGDYRGTLEAIAGMVEDLERGAGAGASVGVGIPGVVDPVTGLVKNANSIWLLGRPLLADLETRLRRPVRVANDANCFTISEATDGAAINADVVFGVILGTGVGGGIVVHRHLLTGPNAVAGEWGHNPLPWPTDDELGGRRCYCGRSGCIETFLSGPAFIEDYRRRGGRSDDPPTIVNRAHGGERTAADVLERYEDRLARALASVINLLDPDVIVLGGGLSNIEHLYTAVPQLWPMQVFSCGSADDARDQSTLPATAETVKTIRTRLVPARHGDSSGVRGAAWLWPEYAR